MRVFIFEHIAGGGEFGHELPAALRDQGAAMLRAAVDDLQRAGCAVATTLDARVSLAMPGAQVTTIEQADDLAAAVRRARRECDGGLIIAPETHGQLARWTRHLFAPAPAASEDADAAPIRNLGSSAPAIDLAGDKLALARHLQAHGIATPATQSTPGDWPYPWIVKPRDGAGCEDTSLIHDARQAEAWRDRGDYVYQPYVTGKAVSASLIVDEDNIVPLVAGEQCVEVNGQMLQYTGGRLPLAADEAHRALTLARNAVSTMPGLNGFVGVDLILAAEPQADMVIEINPRITMSFVALNELSEGSILASLFDSSLAVSWHDQGVTFTAQGAVRLTGAQPA